MKKKSFLKSINKKNLGWMGGIALALVVGLFAGSIGSGGFGYSRKSASSSWYYDNGNYAKAEDEAEADGYYEAPMASESAGGGWMMEAEQKTANAAGKPGSAGYSDGGSGSSNLAMQVGSLNTDNMKLIYRADVQVQTLDFDQAVQDLNGLVAHYAGYFESAYVDNGSYYSGGSYMQGNYVVRVPSKNYQNFINEFGNVAHIVNINQSVEDIGLQYADTEARLETLKIKHDRLLELLSKATEMKDIIELESALSDVEYQIDSFGSRLNRYDSLVGYSTINISISKVNRVDPPIEQDNSFLARLQRSFKNGLDNVKDGLEDFAFWFSYNLVGIIIFVIVAWVVIHFGRKYLKKRRAAKEAEEAAEAAQKADAAPEDAKQ